MGFPRMNRPRLTLSESPVTPQGVTGFGGDMTNVTSERSSYEVANNTPD